jgi:hypothetical protein
MLSSYLQCMNVARESSWQFSWQFSWRTHSLQICRGLGCSWKRGSVEEGYKSYNKARLCTSRAWEASAKSTEAGMVPVDRLKGLLGRPVSLSLAIPQEDLRAGLCHDTMPYYTVVCIVSPLFSFCGGVHVADGG